MKKNLIILNLLLGWEIIHLSKRGKKVVEEHKVYDIAELVDLNISK